MAGGYGTMEDAYMLAIRYGMCHNAISDTSAPPDDGAELLWTRFRALIELLVLRARTSDMYELDPNPRPIGGERTFIFWNNDTWYIEDFMALMLDAICFERALRDSTEDDSGIDEDDDAFSRRTEPLRPSTIHVAAIVDPDSTWRLDPHAILCFLFWLSVHVDTRIERVCCKYNDRLVASELDLGTPSITHCLNVRRGLQIELQRFIEVHGSARTLSLDISEWYSTGMSATRSGMESDPSETAVYATIDGAKSQFAEISMPGVTQIVFCTSESNTVK